MLSKMRSQCRILSWGDVICGETVAAFIFSFLKKKFFISFILIVFNLFIVLYTIFTIKYKIIFSELCWVLPNSQHESAKDIAMSPPFEPPSHLPPHPTPLGC